MTDIARRREIDDWFERALDQPTEERAAWVEAECADAELRAEVHALLAAHDQASGILDRDAVSPAVSLLGDPLRGRRVGPYRLLRELGRGGMGVVYLAERDDGQFRRRVALKLLRSGPDADELRRRFVAERQILASLSHPNIAGLLDGGVTDGQLPYLVMEYVDGLPITTYCDRHRLSIDDRLRLFQKVCAAVHHAHQNLVLHRDLKPGNILVAADGSVKLLDFGIAKLLNPVLAFEQPLTRTDLRVFTPEYASPEQIRGESLTTASDVFALGVVLYELLCGARPFRVKSGAFQEVSRLVCELDVERPSAHVAAATAVPEDSRDGDVAAARGTTRERLVRELRGDLDAIALFALRKEAGRRYGSAELLAQDVERYLIGAPVLAHRGNAWYRVRKLTSRHRASAAALAIALVAILAGAGMALRQASVARAERDRAEAALSQSEETTNFLMGLFEASDPEQLRGDSLTAGELLRRGVARVEQLGSQPLAQARLLQTSAIVYRNMAQFGPAVALLERSVALREKHLGPNHPELAAGLYVLADMRRREGRPAEAHALSARALAIRRKALGDRHPDVAESLLQHSSHSIYLADLPAAESLARQALDIRRDAFGPDHPLVAQAMEILGSTVARRGKIEEAQSLVRAARDIYVRTEGPDGPRATFVLLRMADLAEHDGRFQEAEMLRRQVVDVRRRAGGAGPMPLAWALGDLALTLSARREFAEAERAAREAYAIVVRVYGPDHPTSADHVGVLAEVIGRAGRLAEAESLQRRSVEIWRHSLGPRHNGYLGTVQGLAVHVARRGKLQEADSLLGVVLTTREDSLSDRQSPLYSLTLARIAALRGLQGRRPEADSLYKLALRLMFRHTSAEHRDVRAISAGLARVHAEWGHEAEAERWRRAARGVPPYFFDLWPDVR